MAITPKPFSETDPAVELMDEADPLDPGAPVPTAGARLDPAEDYDAGEYEPFAEGAKPQGGGVSEMLRRAMVAGLGAVFMTEEGIRALVKDMKLPKDVMGFVVGQAERSKADLFRVIGEELRRFFESAALRREFTKLLSDVTIEVKAEIRLRPDTHTPEVKVQSTTARRNSKKKKP